jgi:hypothetical protein
MAAQVEVVVGHREVQVLRVALATHLLEAHLRETTVVLATQVPPLMGLEAGAVRVALVLLELDLLAVTEVQEHQMT